MNAAEVIKEAAAAGVQIAIEGDGLSLEASAPPPKAIIELITQHKLEIIKLLRGPGGPGAQYGGWRRLGKSRLVTLPMRKVRKVRKVFSLIS